MAQLFLTMKSNVHLIQAFAINGHGVYKVGAAYLTKIVYISYIDNQI